MAQKCNSKLFGSLEPRKTKCEAKYKQNELLPSELCIRSAGTHLYAIGLSLINDHKGVTRNRFHSPILILLIQLFFICRSIVVMVLPEKKLYFYRYLGDFGYVFGTRLHFNLTVCFSIGLTIASQLLNFYILRKGVCRRYMRVFQMMSGSVKPQNIGLENKHSVSVLIKRATLLFRIGDYIPLSLSLTIFMINLFSFSSNSSTFELILYVIPNSILWFIVVNIVYAMIFWQTIYFYLIALYLELKLKDMNNNLKNIVKKKTKISNRHSNSSKIIRDYYSIYQEIGEYDATYWSQFLFFIWLTCSTIICTISYFLIFGEMRFFLRLLCLYFDLFYICLLILIIEMSSSVHKEANISYKLFNCLIIKLNDKFYKSFKVRIN